MDWIANAVQGPVSLMDDKDGGNLKTKPIKLSSLIWAHMWLTRESAFISYYSN